MLDYPAFTQNNRSVGDGIFLIFMCHIYTIFNAKSLIASFLLYRLFMVVDIY